MIAMCEITTGVTGLSFAPVGTASIAVTTARDSSSATTPKMVCLACNQGVGAVVMKNCDPFVPGPAFAIANMNGCEKLSSG